MALEKLYTATETMEAHFVANMLEGRGVPASVAGETLAAARGGLPPTPETQPSVWVPAERLAEAKAILTEYLDGPAAQPERPAWNCPACGETIEGQFSQCWNCGADRYAPPEEPEEIPSTHLTLDDVPNPDDEQWEAIWAFAASFDAGAYSMQLPTQADSIARAFFRHGPAALEQLTVDDLRGLLNVEYHRWLAAGEAPSEQGALYILNLLRVIRKTIGEASL
jgi:hypothetical protein